MLEDLNTSDKSPPPCWIDKRLESSKGKTDSKSKTKLYGIWRKYRPSTKKKIIEDCGKKAKKAINKKK